MLNTQDGAADVIAAFSQLDDCLNRYVDLNCDDDSKLRSLTLMLDTMFNVVLMKVQQRIKGVDCNEC